MANSLLDTVEPCGYRMFDGEGNFIFREELPDQASIDWAARYGRKWEAVYSHPNVESLLSQYAKAIETAAIMRAAEWYKKEGWLKDEEDIPAGILALIPQDGRTKLEEFGMKVAVSVAHLALSKAFIRTLDSWGRNKPQIEDDLRAIVTNLIGEK